MLFCYFRLLCRASCVLAALVFSLLLSENLKEVENDTTTTMMMTMTTMTVFVQHDMHNAHANEQMILSFR